MGEKFINKTQEQFTIVFKSITRDKRLNASDRGVLLTLLSLPTEKWRFSIAGLMKIIPENGRSSLTASVDRLCQFGYVIKHEQNRGDSGTFDGVSWEVLQSPINSSPTDYVEKKRTKKVKSPLSDNQTTVENQQSPFTDYPIADKPIADKPIADNQQQYNNKELNNKEVNNQSSITDGVPTGRAAGMRRKNNTSVSKHKTALTGSMLGMSEDEIKLLINYDKLIKTYPGYEEYTDFIVEILNDAFNPAGNTVTVGKNELSAESVYNHFIKITMQDVINVITTFCQKSEPVANPYAYLLVMLYNEVGQKKMASRSRAKTPAKNVFNDIEKRDYDFSALEAALQCKSV